MCGDFTAISGEDKTPFKDLILTKFKIEIEDVLEAFKELLKIFASKTEKPFGDQMSACVDKLQTNQNSLKFFLTALLYSMNTAFLIIESFKTESHKQHYIDFVRETLKRLEISRYWKIKFEQNLQK